MVIPRLVERLQEVVVQAAKNVFTHLKVNLLIILRLNGIFYLYLSFQMRGHHLLEACVETFAVLVENHCVGISVKFLERQSGIVFFLYFLDGVLQQSPY